jgi:hypothetical protein
MKDFAKINAVGRVIIRDLETNRIVVDKNNAVHPQHLAVVISRALSRDANGYIFSLAFGNGGTFLNTSNQIVYRPPNTVGASTLYNQTYSVQVDDQSTGTPSTNSVTSAPSTSPAITSIITVIAQLNATEPSGQAASDNLTTNSNSAYTFDEIGLVSPDGLLLTHLTFNPFEKTANRAFSITYTLTISVS